MIISQRAKMYIYIRLVIHKYICLCATADWSPTTKQYIKSNPFWLWNGYLITNIGQFYPIILAYYTYTNMISDNDDFEENNQPNMPQFTTTNCMGMALTCAIGIIAVAAHRILAYASEMTYLVNQMYKFSDTLEEMMSRKRLHFNVNQARMIKGCEYLLLMTAFFSTITPLGYGLFFTSSSEPVHQLFKEWLEIEVKLDARSSPLIFLFMWAALAGAGAAFILLHVLVLYVFFTLICVSSLTPSNIYRAVRKPGESGNEYTLDTQFGLMGEEESILSYRTQQVFNLCINKVVASVFISLHQVAFMVILVGASFMFITISKDLANAEVSVVLFLTCAIGSVVLMISSEYILIGNITTASKKFLVTSKNLTFRRSLYNKFLKCCPTFSVNMAYPFFKIQKNTFAEFMCQYLDFLVQLLVCQ
ncbi:unnamed protein product [Orchesella dallaii]|uniref:Odorant receptor n=1 Tax=Orchesella dallaii TaxID=48710 RepID=A0ABP1R7F0_9HEXA